VSRAVEEEKEGNKAKSGAARKPGRNRPADQNQKNQFKILRDVKQSPMTHTREILQAKAPNSEYKVVTKYNACANVRGYGDAL
jgi:hypothetical protein